MARKVARNFSRTVQRQRQASVALGFAARSYSKLASVRGFFIIANPRQLWIYAGRGFKPSRTRGRQTHVGGQRASDLDFVRRLARRNGFLFWVDCDKTGTETAHFRRPNLGGKSVLNLDINIPATIWGP